MDSMELFAGYGGLAIATENVFGARTAMLAEWEANLTPVLDARFPGVDNLRDVTEVHWPNLSRFLQLDLIGGGSPCQDVSTAGPRLGMKAGTRSGLWSSMRDAIAELRPEWVVWENVRGVLSARATSLTPELEDEAEAKKAPRLRALGRVLGDLTSLGYDVQWRGIRASDVAAPHQRFRIFVLARLRSVDSMLGQPSANSFAVWDEDADLWIQPEPSLLGDDVFTKPFPTDGAVTGGVAFPLPKWSAAKAPATMPTPRTTDGNGVGKHGSGGPDLRTVVSLLPTPVASRVNDGEDVAGWDARRARIKAQGINGNGMGEPLTIAAQRLALLPTPAAADGNGGKITKTPGDRRPDGSKRQVTIASAVHHELSVEESTTGTLVDWGKYADAIARWERVSGRLAPAPTEEGTRGAQRLSPRFVEWMMGLPSGWVTDPALGLSRSAQLKALGNGVVPAQAEAALADMKARFLNS